MIWQVCMTIALVCFPAGYLWIACDWSPFPQITTRGETWGSFLILVSFAALFVGLIAFVWGV